MQLMKEISELKRLHCKKEREHQIKSFFRKCMPRLSRAKLLGKPDNTTEDLCLVARKPLTIHNLYTITRLAQCRSPFTIFVRLLRLQLILTPTSTSTPTPVSTTSTNRSSIGSSSNYKCEHNYYCLVVGPSYMIFEGQPF